MPEPVILEWSTNQKGEDPFLIGGFDLQKVAKAVSQKMLELFQRKTQKRKGKYPVPKGECHFRIFQLDFLEGKFYLVLQDFNSLEQPVESKSKEMGSQAIYYGASERAGVLIQYLPPHSQTSSHNHEQVGWIERYYLIAGEARLRTCKGQSLLNTINPISPIIESQVIHQVVTDSEPSLIAIEIKGDQDWFNKWQRGQGHCFKEFH